MRNIDMEHETLSAATDEELLPLLREYLEEHDPDGAPEEDELRELLEERVYDAEDS